MEAVRNRGRVALVGAGPGDPELLTLKAVRFLEQADAVVYDHLVGSGILHHCKPAVDLIFAGKEKGNHALPQDKINALLAELVERHALVVRLKGGDPFVFGRGGEEMEHLLALGIECEVVPGITAACGAAASLGLPLTHRDYSSEIRFLTGHKRTDGDYTHFENVDLSRQTCVVYMGLTILPEIMRIVAGTANNATEPVCVISHATRNNQQFRTGTVETIAALLESNPVSSPALVVMGRVVHALECNLAWSALREASQGREESCFR